MTKRVLITGKNSYIGRSFIEYCEKKQVYFEIDELNTHDDDWKALDFSSYDTIIHLAGIAHIKETKQNEHLYYEVNRDLAIDIAEKAKNSGVKHFIFMSTMSVYGLVEGHIDENTPTNPNNAYGKSKLQAEEKIKTLSSDNFIISIVRPPMIYGPGSKGNYALLSRFAQKTILFPTLDNNRSMLFIGNLSEFLINLIDNPSPKYYYPQNKEYVNTKELIKEIALNNDNRILFLSFFNPFIRLFKFNMIKKVFGDLTYDKKISSEKFVYQIFGFKETIKKSENSGV